MMRIINWINNHEYEHKECHDWKKESCALVNMSSRKDKEERKSMSVHPIVIFVPSVTYCVCKYSSLEIHDAKRQFPSLGGFTRLI